MFFVGSVELNDTYVVSEEVTFYDDGTSRDFMMIKQQTLKLIMSKTDDKINETLNIDTEIKKESTQCGKKSNTDRSANIETDYKYARDNLYNLVERGQDAIDGILDLSRETEHTSI